MVSSPKSMFKMFCMILLQIKAMLVLAAWPSTKAGRFWQEAVDYAARAVRVAAVTEVTEITEVLRARCFDA